ncbi:MAG TPA: hypothetical protein VEU06_08905 [Micropepsaceae bacterium]|nr:hypothetical protein [Micropepsaceae bacterium]
MKRAIVLLLVLFFGQARAAGQDFCSDLVDRISSGAADRAPNGDAVLKTLAARFPRYVQLDQGDSGEIDLATVLQQDLNAPPEFLEAMMVHFPNFAGTNVRVLALGASGAGALNSVAGTLRCPDLVFFDMPHGQVQEVMPPDWYQPYLCMRIWVGEIDQVPAAMTERDEDRMAELTITPWLDHKWGPDCLLTATYESVGQQRGRFQSVVRRRY